MTDYRQIADDCISAVLEHTDNDSILDAIGHACFEDVSDREMLEQISSDSSIIEYWSDKYSSGLCTTVCTPDDVFHLFDRLTPHEKHQFVCQISATTLLLNLEDTAELSDVRQEAFASGWNKAIRKILEAIQKSRIPRHDEEAQA